MINRSAGGAAGLPDATQLAIDRTRLAYERTLMAWVRTATSLISFGFTIYKFFQFLHAESKGANSAYLLGSREFALLMILIGLVMLVLATLQHWQQLRMLRAHGASIPFSLAMVLACLIGGLGVVGAFVALFRH